MAEAIARHWLTQQATPLTRLIEVASAGTEVAAANPVTAQARRALQQQSIVHEGVSQAVSVALLRQSDLVFTMTAAHQQQLIPLLQASAEQRLPMVFSLHPEADIDDPLGRGQACYHRLAAEFMQLIPARLQQLLHL